MSKVRQLSKLQHILLLYTLEIHQHFRQSMPYMHNPTKTNDDNNNSSPSTIQLGRSPKSNPKKPRLQDELALPTRSIHHDPLTHNNFETYLRIAISHTTTTTARGVPSWTWSKIQMARRKAKGKSYKNVEWEESWRRRGRRRRRKEGVPCNRGVEGAMRHSQGLKSIFQKAQRLRNICTCISLLAGSTVALAKARLKKQYRNKPWDRGTC